MGGCASKPQELDLQDKTSAEKVEPNAAPQENNGGENENTEETLADPAEPKQEAKDSEEMKPSEGEEKGEANANTKAAASLEPVNALETVKEEAEPTEAHNSDDKSDEPLISL